MMSTLSKFFSPSLYREGLKKSRIVGIAITLIVTVPAITGIISQLLTYGIINPSTTIFLDSTIIYYFASSAKWVILLTPLLTLNLFGFLNRRNESDFYHSIPFTRPAVYFSFLSAALTWVAVAIALPVLISTLFYAISPMYTIDFFIPLQVFLTYFLAALQLMALTIVAMTLTGTLLSNILVFLLLFTLPLIAGALFSWYLTGIFGTGGVFPMMVLDLTPLRFLQFSKNLPVVLNLPLILDGHRYSDVFYDIPLWLYTAVVSLLLILAGCLFYTKRRSEIAGRAASTPILQHVFRCAFVLPLTFVVAIVVLQSRPSEVATPLIVYTAITLLAYYLYEIITTKRLKNLWKATFFVPVLVVGGVLFGVSAKGAEYVASHYTPDADDLRSVSIYIDSSQTSAYHSFEELAMQSIECKDPEALEFVAAKLTQMRQVDAESASYGAENYYYGRHLDSSSKRITLKITEKSGRVCGRNFTLSYEDYHQLLALLGKSEKMQDTQLSIPTEKQISRIDLFGLEEENSTVYWNTFVKEYNALSREEKLQYKAVAPQSDSILAFEIQGTINGTDYFRSTYPLDARYFPETTKAMVEILQERYEQRFAKAIADFHDPNHSLGYHHSIQLESEDFSRTVEYSGASASAFIIKTTDFLATCQVPAQGEEVRVAHISFFNSIYSAEQYYALSPEDFDKLCEIMGYVKSAEVPQ